MSERVSIQTGDFDLGQEVAKLRANDQRVGAVCTFTGTVRDRNDGLSVSSMELEHYPGMTEKAIDAMVDEAVARFAVYGVRIIHRVGLLQPLDQVVMVAVTSAHRGTSFQACEFLMDYLKTQAPFWWRTVPTKLHTAPTRWSWARSVATSWPRSKSPVWMDTRSLMSAPGHGWEKRDFAAVGQHGGLRRHDLVQRHAHSLAPRQR